MPSPKTDKYDAPGGHDIRVLHPQRRGAAGDPRHPRRQGQEHQDHLQDREPPGNGQPRRDHRCEFFVLVIIDTVYCQTDNYKLTRIKILIEHVLQNHLR